MFLHDFVYHVGSGFTQLLLIIWQRARWLFLKDANLKTIGGEGSCAVHNISILEKPSIMGNALCCLCRLWFF